MATSNYPDCIIEPITPNEEDFRKSLFVRTRLVSVIEDDDLKQYALQCIPVEDLTIKATQTLSALEEEDCCIEDCLILELLHWYKYSYFTWVDAPDCQKCGNPTVFSSTVTPTSDELTWLARKVENYYCNACELYTRFPRYNHPKKLLETRKGRCGEWANCFFLICRAIDLDVRLVLDWNDHIWVEMFSPSKQRWVHCDPCENILDQPLLYESGWKKDMLFVIAFSKDEVQDVTWRYTKKFLDVLERRRAYQCREKFVLGLLNYYTNKCRSNASPEERERLCKRQVSELAEFLSPPKTSDQTIGGRISGSIAWRVARGEIGAEMFQNPYTFNLSAREIEEKHFHIQYSCAADEYTRVSEHSNKIKSWNSLVFEMKHLFRKHELDWKTAYLARVEGCPHGIVMWKFDFEESGLVIQKLNMNFSGKTYHSGKVKWHLSPIKKSGPRIEKLYTTEVLHLGSESTKDFEGAIGLTLMVELSDGDGQLAWQHAQIFRQELSSTEFPFEIEIFFEKG